MKTMLCSALLAIGLSLCLTAPAPAQYVTYPTFTYPYVVPTPTGLYNPAYGFSPAYGYSPAYGFSPAYSGYSPAYQFSPAYTTYYPGNVMYRYIWWRR